MRNKVPSYVECGCDPPGSHPGQLKSINKTSWGVVLRFQG